MLASCGTKTESAENSLSLSTSGILPLSLYNSQTILAGNYHGLCNNNEMENSCYNLNMLDLQGYY